MRRWHNINAYAYGDPASEQINFVCEIPKFGRAKMECNTKGEYNPIVQDLKKGKLRYYHGSEAACTNMSRFSD